MTKKGFSVRKIRLTRQIEFLWGVNIKFKIRRGSRWARRGRFGSRMHSAAWSLLKSSVWLEQKIKEAEFCVVCSYACWQLLRLAFSVALLGCFQRAPKQTRSALLMGRKTRASAHSITRSTVLLKMAWNVYIRFWNWYKMFEWFQVMMIRLRETTEMYRRPSLICGCGA